MPNQMSVFGSRSVVYDDRLKVSVIRLLMKFGMKNPYADKKIVFSPEYLTKKALDIRTIKSQCTLYLQQMRYLVGDLEALWLNDIQTSFIAELENIYNSLMEFTDLADEFASFLDTASQELSENPTETAKYAVLAEETNEPVRVALSHLPERRAHKEPMANDRFGLTVEAEAQPDHSILFYLYKPLSIFGIKNPYEKEKAQFTPASLKSRALDMRSILSQYDYNAKKIQYSIEELENMWQNDSQSVFINELKDRQCAVKDFTNLTEEYASLLEMAAQELETSTIDLDKASVLTGTSEGPVTVVLSNISYLKGSRIDLKAYDPYFERTQAGISTELSTSRKNAEYLYNVYNDHIELVKYIGLKRTIEIPSEIDGLPVTHIGFNCFSMAWRVKLVSVTIPDSVTTIYHGAFRGCQTIRELKLSQNLKYIGNYAFAFLTDLEDITLPENIVSFGMGAFRNCVNLRSVRIPKSTLLRIGNDCFYGCKYLERVDIGDDVVDIDDWAFKACEHLDTVSMGENVVNIGESAFYNCIRLLRLDIPETVKNIGDTAFYSRRGMTLGVTAGSTAEKYAVAHNIPFVQV